NLVDDGALILKFFLHISKAEQKKRFNRLESDELNAWRVTDEDWRNHKRYDKWLLAYEEMLEKTDTEWGVWTIVEATDRRHSLVKVYETIVEALEERLGIQAEPSEPGTAGQSGEAPAPPREEVETEMEEAGVPPVAEDLEDVDRPPQRPDPAKPAGPTPAEKLKYILSMQDSMPLDTPATSEIDPEAGDA
ncbi:MAG TPA: hypothetical protein VF806_05435, partial [Anaerolineaceae bacterium]